MDSLYHNIRLPGINIPGNLFLAPLAGFTDRAFRDICIENGADFSYTEMVSCEGIIRGNLKTIELMRKGEREKLYAVQLFSGEPTSAAASVSGLKDFAPDLIDLNCGCPVPKVVKAGAGAALMKNPGEIGKIISAIKTALNDAGMNIPVTVKIRSGWDSSDLTWREAALRAAEGGASMVTLHPRTRKQGYSGTSDWELIMRLKEEMTVPVIGSGDLFTPGAIKSMLETTKCDGVMLARGAIGNPFLFRETRKLLTLKEENSEQFRIPAEEKLNAALKHIRLANEYFGAERACRELKKHLCAYTKGITGGGELRNKLVQVHSIEEYQPLIKNFLSL